MDRRAPCIGVLLGAWLLLHPAAAPEARGGPPLRAPPSWGELVIVGFDGTKPSDRGVEQVYADLKAGRAGGVILFDRNIHDRVQLSTLAAHLKRASPANPPFLAIDEEGGLVERLDTRRGFTAHPSAARVAATRTSEEARTVFRRMAEEIADVGLNLNLAPVVDLAVNAENPVVAKLDRSYGREPEKVSAYADAFVSAHGEAGVLTVLKHWPGHGSSTTDSHLGATNVSSVWSLRETLPFRLLMRAGKADMIMSGHLHHSGWGDRAHLPASLSRTAITIGLRRKFGYGGVVVTDDLQMRAVLSRHRLDEAIVLALAAGNDIVLIGNALEYQPHPAAFAIAAIEQGLRDGRLDRAALKRSVERVRRLRERLSGRSAARPPLRAGQAP